MSIATHLYGQSLAARLLDAAAGRPVQAYLLVGPARTGKRLAAQLFVQALCCSFRDDPPCGACESCRAVAGGYFPDWHLWEPDPTKKKRTIKIEQIRHIQRLSAQHPLAAPYQVLQVNEAQAMELEAAQCFLKTLEEPAPHTIHLLVATSTVGILPTILSRCQLVPLHLVPAATIAGELQTHFGSGREQAQDLAVKAQGRIGWAIASARNEEPAASTGDNVADWPEGRLDATRLAEKWLQRSPEELVASLQHFQRLLYAKGVQNEGLSWAGLEALQLCEGAIADLQHFVSPKLTLEVTLARLAKVAAEVKQ